MSLHLKMRDKQIEKKQTQRQINKMKNRETDRGEIAVKNVLEYKENKSKNIKRGKKKSKKISQRFVMRKIKV